LVKTCVFLLLDNLTGPALSFSLQSLESFEKELKCINVMQCRRPSSELPLPVLISPLNESLNGEYKMFVRYWLDEDGDRQREIYDVEKLGKSYYTTKIFGYPIRKPQYGKWKVGFGSIGGWFPLILLDTLTNDRYEVFYLRECWLFIQINRATA
jgi:hypothetical protein